MRSLRNAKSVIRHSWAAYGEPTEPGLCPLCGERTGTVRIRNVVAVPEGELPNPRPDAWVCEPCMQSQMREAASRQAGEWQARIDAESNARRKTQLIAQASDVAAAIESLLTAAGAQPDASTAAFLTRYGR